MTQVKPHVILELPDGDSRTARVVFSELQGNDLHVCIVVSEQPAQVPQLTVERILELAHRIATKYTHRSDPTYCSYGFVKHTMIDFARAIEREIRG